MRNHLAPVLLTLLLAGSAGAADYYVSATGSDTASGTVSSPWKTLSKVSARALAAGDRVFLQGGATFAGPLTANWSGAAGSPIIVDSYGTGRATIQITNATDPAILVYNRQYLEFRNLRLVGTQMATSTKAGFEAFADLAREQPYLVVRGCEATGFKRGIQVGAWNGTFGFTDVVIENCEAHNNRSEGIFSYGQTTGSHNNLTIRGCVAHHNRGDAASTGNSGNGILVNGVTGGLVEKCLAYDNGDVGFGSVGIWTYGVSGVTIQYCEVYRQRSSKISDGGGFDFDGGTVNSVMQYNYSHDNDGAGYLFAQYGGAMSAYGPLSGNVVRYNLSKNDGRRLSYGGLTFWGAGGSDQVGANEIHNNTIYMGGTPADGNPACVSFFGSNFSGLRIRNNVFIAADGRMLVNADSAMSTTVANHQGNLWFAVSGTTFAIKWGGMTYGSLADWRATGQEMNGANPIGLSADPRLTAPATAGIVATTLADAGNLLGLFGAFTPFRPQAGSPVIDAGLNLTSSAWGSLAVGSRDFSGVAIPQGAGYEIGAHETATSTAAPGITSQPANATVIAGATASFTVAASGSPAPTIQWQRLISANWTNLSGATSTTYSLTTVLGDNGAQFRAVATSSAGTATSNVATLTVTASTAAPAITSQPVHATVTAGATASFTVAASGSPAPTYQWSSAPSGSSTFTAISGATAASYTTGATSIGMSGTQYRCVASSSAGNATSTAATLTVSGLPPVSGLPTGWSTADIGSVAATGSASVSGGVWTVIGSGADIWGTSDEFRFASQPVSGDVVITARVNGLQKTNIRAKAGVMVRETVGATSRHAFTCLTASKGPAFTRRLTTAGSSVDTGGPALSVPGWIRLERVGNLFISSVSSNGTTWTEIRRESIAMSAAVQVGLAVTSHADGTLCTATFTDVAVVRASVAAN